MWRLLLLITLGVALVVAFWSPISLSPGQLISSPRTNQTTTVATVLDEQLRDPDKVITFKPKETQPSAGTTDSTKVIILHPKEKNTTTTSLIILRPKEEEVITAVSPDSIQGAVGVPNDLGKEQQTGDYLFAVQGAALRSEYTASNGATIPAPSGQVFALVEFRATYIGDGRTKLYRSSISLQDGGGNEYGPYDENPRFMDFPSYKLSSGIPITNRIAYLVPAEVSGLCVVFKRVTFRIGEISL